MCTGLSAGVHSRYDQLVGFVKGVVKRGAKRVRVHVLTDGRDVPDGTSKKFVTQLQVLYYGTEARRRCASCDRASKCHPGGILARPHSTQLLRATCMQACIGT